MSDGHLSKKICVNSFDGLTTDGRTTDACVTIAPPLRSSTKWSY